jgi:hypothetical protein
MIRVETRQVVDGVGSGIVVRFGILTAVVSFCNTRARKV